MTRTNTTRTNDARYRLHLLATAAAFGLVAAPALAEDKAAADTSAPAPAASAAGAAPTALAMNDLGSDIVVTARRREEKAQDVPIALSVVGEKTLERTGNFTLGQIQQLVPSLQVFSFNPRNTNINIRGLGSNVALTNDGLENGVGVYVDNVYYGRPGQSQFDLVDLDHVEVLRGPQGTLFGKNTTAGAINISSRLPSFAPDFYGEASVGNYGYYQLRASVSAPLVGDKIAFRLSAARTSHDGYIDNVLTGGDAQDYHNTSVRGQLLLKPSERLSIRLIGDYARQTAACCINLPAGTFTSYTDGVAVPNNYFARIARAGYTPVTLDAFARKTDANSNYQANMRSYGVSGQLDWDLGRATLTAISAYRWWDWDPANDIDSSALSINTLAQTADRQRQFSQEVRLASNGHNRFDWVIGAYYFWQIVRGYTDIGYGSDAPLWYRPPTSPIPLATWQAALNGFSAHSYSNPKTNSYAAFGQTTWHATDALSLTAGLRYTHEDKTGLFNQVWTGGADTTGNAAAIAIRNSFNPVIAYGASRHDDSVSGTANLSYKIDRDVLVYASYSRGGKSGGLNLQSFPIGVTVPRTVAPEKVDAYEIGLKSQFLDRRLTLNLAGFWTNVANYQSAVTTLTNLGTYLQYIQNVGRVRARGAELDTQLDITRRISISGALSYVDAKYRNYRDAPAPVEQDPALGATVDLTGRQIAGAPKFTYSLGADASQPLGAGLGGDLELYEHADYAHRSSFFTAVSNSIYSRVPAYGLLNLRIGVRTANGRWDISVWARNLADKDYFQTLTPNNLGLITAITGDPRTFGATLRTKF